MRNVFVDMDGVLADYDRGFTERFGMSPRTLPKKEMWKKIYSVDAFFYDLPVMREVENLMEVLHHMRNSGTIDGIFILTACPSSAYHEVALQKRRWIRYHIGNYMVLPSYRSESKPAYIQNPGDILIDDWGVNCQEWAAAGGTAVKYENAAQAIVDLYKVLTVSEVEA